MWIDKSKWEQLQFELKSKRIDLRVQEMKTKYWEDKYLKEIRNTTTKTKAIFDEIEELDKVVKSLKVELEKYKNLYVDELQKRIELTDRVRAYSHAQMKEAMDEIAGLEDSLCWWKKHLKEIEKNLIGG